MAKSAEQWKRDRKEFYKMFAGTSISLYSLHYLYELFAALNFDSRAHFAGDDNPNISFDSDPGSSDDEHDIPLPPGEEGLFHSNSGDGVIDGLLVSGRRCVFIHILIIIFY